MRNFQPTLVHDAAIESTPSRSAAAPEQTAARPTTHALLHQAGAQLKALQQRLHTGAGAIDMLAQQIREISDMIERAGLEALLVEQQVAHMRHHAYHDPLTQLPNRALLFDRLGQAMARAMRKDGQLALLLLDLDEFKDVNDRFGHEVGDRLLRAVAVRLTRATRSSDTTCRYGGDEFVILLPDLEGTDGAHAAARKIHTDLAQPFRISGHSISMSASIGIAVYPHDGATVRALFRHADIAMYRSKHQPKWCARN